MATYKVLQDIEAEDKLFGPFTLKQFIFGAITIILGVIGFQILIAGVPTVFKVPFLILLVPPMLLFGFLAAPIGRDQPTDVWLLARLRFLFKPRVRIWNQDGMSELVTITAPKRDDHVYTNTISQTEVRSRLQALANTVDTRGWAVKNVNANLFSQPGYLSEDTQSDRLLSPAELPQDTPIVGITAADDILDPVNNSTAQHLDQLVQQSASAHKQQIVQQMNQPDPIQPQQPAAPAPDFWFMNEPAAPQASLPQDFATFSSQPVVSPGAPAPADTTMPTAEEEALVQKISATQQEVTSHLQDRLRVVQPLHDREGNIIRAQPIAPVQPQQPAATAPQPEPAVSPAILGLAQNDDLNVATIARQAKRMNNPDDGEVVISLH